MQYSPTFTTPPPQTQNRPSLHSFDSTEECSVEHWIEVNWRVELAAAEDDLSGYFLEDSCFVGSR